ANSPHSFALLREHNERPASRRTNNQCDELAPPHCLPRGSGQRIVAVQMRVVKGCSMSALGQKQAYEAQKGVCALAPRATAKAKFCKSACPLCRRKRTCAVQLGMSALGQ